MLLGYHHLHPTLSLVPSALAGCWQPHDCSHTVRSEKMFYSLSVPTRRERPARLSRTLSCPAELTCMATVRTTELRHPCRSKGPSAPSMQSPQERAGIMVSPGPLLSILWASLSPLPCWNNCSPCWLPSQNTSVLLLQTMVCNSSPAVQRRRCQVF